MKHKFILVSLILISTFTIKSLLHSGFFTSHDGEHQIVRLMHFHQGLIDGQFPVRWAGTALEGNGYPLFIFTYRLPFWIAELWYLFSGSLTDSIKFAFIFSYVISALSMYWFLFRLTKSKWSSVIGTFVYQLAPYRFLDIFVRAALGEAFTFVFIPLIFLGLYELSKNKKVWLWVLVTVAGFSGLLLSHIMTFIIFLPAIILWGLLHFSLCNKRKMFIFNLLISGILTLLLSAYYWMPAMMEKADTIFSQALSAYYQDHFVTFKQLLYSPWLFGFDMPGTINDMMSFQIGISQWLIIALVCMLLIVIPLTQRFPKIMLFKTRLIHKINYLYLIYTFFIISFSIFMMLPYSSKLYQKLNSIMVIDLPWKFISVVVFVISIAHAIIISKIRNRALFMAFNAFVMLILIYSNRNHIRVNEYTYKSDQEYWSYTATSNQNDEYSPKDYTPIRDNNNGNLTVFEGSAINKIIKRGGDQMIFESNVSSEEAVILTGIINYPQWSTFIDGKITETEDNHGNIIVNLSKGIHNVELKFRDAQLLSYQGNSDNTLVKRNSKSLIFTAHVKSDKVKVLTKIADFPGWTQYVDGVKQNIDTIQGRIIVHLNQGEHKVVLNFRNTPIRTLSNSISLLTLLGVFSYSGYLWKKQKL